MPCLVGLLCVVTLSVVPVVGCGDNEGTGGSGVGGRTHKPCSARIGQSGRARSPCQSVRNPTTWFQLGIVGVTARIPASAGLFS
jgi:hypothetical protein